MLRPSSFYKLSSHKLADDPLGKIKIAEYMEDGHSNDYAIMEATVSCDEGKVYVRLKDGIHFTYIDGKLNVKIDATSFKNIFKGVLMGYHVAYVTKKTYELYLKETQNPNLLERSTNVNYAYP